MAIGGVAETALRAGDLTQAEQTLRQLMALVPELSEDSRGRVALMAAFLLGTTHLKWLQRERCSGPSATDACILTALEPSPATRLVPAASHARHAMLLFADIARHLPADAPFGVAARWLLHVTASLDGLSPAALRPELRLPPEAFPLDTSFPRFRDLAPELALATEGYAGSVVIDDFDGDELLDIVTCQSDPAAPLRVFRNRGDGTFTDVSDTAGLDGITGGFNLLQGDYDDDGDLDILVLRGAWRGSQGQWPNSLLRNDGGLHFTDVTYAAGLADPAYPTQTAAWADYDRDGDLDLYVGNESLADAVRPSQLFRNEGDGTFTDVAAQAGVTNEAWSKGVVWGDYDDDGDPDLFVSNFRGPNRLYRNDGDGTFTDVATPLGVLGPQSSFSTWFWDANGDGLLDLLVNAYQRPIRRGDPPHVWYVAAARMGLPLPADVELPRLYLGRPDGTFHEAAAAFGLTLPSLPMGANFGDLDNDGWLDFYLGTGYPGYEGLMPNVMFRNLAGERFQEVTFSGGFGHLQKGHGIAFADLDNDGDQDVFAQMGGMLGADAARDALFVNPGFGNHWIKVRLLGTRSDRFGVGARIRVQIDEGGRQRSLVRWIGPGGSFGANPLRAEIGLGTATRVRRLQVRWPTSGIVQEFTDLPVDTAYVLHEQGGIRPLELPRFDLAEAARRHSSGDQHHGGPGR